MDRYLFNQFIFEMDEELYDDTCVAFAKNATTMIRKPDGEKVTFNYFPQESDHLQLVVEGDMDNNTAHITGVKMHHTSEDVWRLKIVAPIDGCEGSYLATRPDGNGLVAVRLVNEQVLDTVEGDSVLDAQVVAFAVDVNIYQDETAYANSNASAEEPKLLMKDGLVVATNYLANNAANLTKEEWANKEHGADHLVDVCGSITMCYKYSLNMLGLDLNSYYVANIMTDFGQLKIVIATPLMPKGVKGFGVGNVIAGKVLLSGDVCIYDYDKYAHLIN